MSRVISSPCEAARPASDMGNQVPGPVTFDGFLPILCRAAASPGPGEGTFDDPSAGFYAAVDKFSFSQIRSKAVSADGPSPGAPGRCIEAGRSKRSCESG